jgi:hypothetical protein
LGISVHGLFLGILSWKCDRTSAELSSASAEIRSGLPSPSPVEREYQENDFFCGISSVFLYYIRWNETGNWLISDKMNLKWMILAAYRFIGYRTRHNHPLFCRLRLQATFYNTICRKLMFQYNIHNPDNVHDVL